MSVKEKFEAILRKYSIDAYYHQGADMEVPNIPREIVLYCNDSESSHAAVEEFITMFNTKGQEMGDDGACLVLHLTLEHMKGMLDLKVLGRDY